MVTVRVMVKTGLLVRADAKSGREPEVEALLRHALALVRKEPETTAWFGLRFGRSRFGLFEVFPAEQGRDAHMSGGVARVLSENAERLFSHVPKVEKVDVIADKLPSTAGGELLPKALLLQFRARHGHERDVERFLREARSIVEREPRTAAWFALKFENGAYGIFDVFPGHRGRIAHLTGRVPRRLAMHALSLFGGVPELKLPSVLGEKMPGQSAFAS